MYRHPARIIIIGASSAGRKEDTHIYREMNSDPLRIDSGKNLKNLNFIFRITLLRSGVACKYTHRILTNDYCEIEFILEA